MARQKPSSPLRRELSNMHEQSNGVIHRNGYSENGTVENKQTNGSANGALSDPQAQLQANISQAGLAELVICVGGIYASLYVSLCPITPRILC